MPPGQKRDPHYMKVKNGNYLSLHSKAKNQLQEDNHDFNPATMGNRLFKKLNNRKGRSFHLGGDGLKRAASNKLRGYGQASKGRMGYGKAKKGVY